MPSRGIALDIKAENGFFVQYFYDHIDYHRTWCDIDQCSWGEMVAGLNIDVSTKQQNVGRLTRLNTDGAKKDYLSALMYLMNQMSPDMGACWLGELREILARKPITYYLHTGLDFHQCLKTAKEQARRQAIDITAFHYEWVASLYPSVQKYDYFCGHEFRQDIIVYWATCFSHVICNDARVLFRCDPYGAIFARHLEHLGSQMSISLCWQHHAMSWDSLQEIAENSDESIGLAIGSEWTRWLDSSQPECRMRALIILWFVNMLSVLKFSDGLPFLCEKMDCNLNSQQLILQVSDILSCYKRRYAGVTPEKKFSPIVDMKNCRRGMDGVTGENVTLHNFFIESIQSLYDLTGMPYKS